MLFRTLKKLKEHNGFSVDMKIKIDVFYALGRLSESEYIELMSEQDIVEM